MSMPSPLFDRRAVAQKRARALKHAEPALFLHEIAAAEVSERLSEINRSFKKVAIIGSFSAPWLQAFPNARMVNDDDVLDIEEKTFDLIIHGLSLHSANDPVGQLVQCRRALKPDGLFIGVMLGGQTLSELRASLSEAETRVTGGLSPRVAPMAELRDLGGLIQRAGLALPVADSQKVPASYRDIYGLIRDLRAMGETNSLSGRRKTFTSKAVMALAAEIYADNFRCEDGRVKATFELIFLTGWAPSETQPKPLRPGSAQSRLADALGVAEFNEDVTPADLDADLP